MQFLIFLLIVIVIAIAFQPKAPGLKPPSLSELEIPTAEKGRPIPKVFGTWVVQSPNIVWYGDLGYNDVTKSGGK